MKEIRSKNRFLKSMLVWCLLLSLKASTTERPDTIAIPDTILKIAHSRGAVAIEKYTKDNLDLYFIPMTGSQREQLKKTIQVYSENYYDGTGRIVAVFKRATQGMFMRAQHWEPSTFHSSQLIKLGTVWRATDQSRNKYH